MLKPRPYQSLATNNVQEKKINLIVMPQRSGKSFTMEMIIQTLQPKKTLIIVGYRKIILQLKNYFDDSTFILSGKPFNSNAAVHIASFQTLDNRNIDLSQYDCIIQDEYHSRTSKKAKSIVFQENTTICLFTGTPLDNKNRLLTKDIDNLIQPTSVKELIENKWLAPTQFSMNSNMIERNSQDLFTKKQDFDETVVRRIIQKEDLLELI
ncbi:MAG: DEAD/DEAH box helicase family protein, partial [Bacteroidales bacterium]|nr:DEAD/DEAH box helicase family protein [Bacteroidales bacterium]